MNRKDITREGRASAGAAASGMRFVFLLVLAWGVGVALADEPLLWLPEGVDLHGRKFTVHSVTALDPRADEAHVSESLRTELTKSLAQLNILDASDDVSLRSVWISCEVRRFSAGNVAGRWIGGKFGAAYIVVLVKLTDPQSQEVLGEMVSAQEIAGGGLFSIGAGNTIVSDAADNVIKAISGRVGR
jgi:hypothetical protein